MARKMEGVLPTAKPATEPPPPDLSLGDGSAPKPKRGRPSNLELQAREARQQAAVAATLMKPEEVYPMTLVVLRLLCKVAKGDVPTDEDVRTVNGPATMVLNKHAVSNKYAAEFALLGSVLIVVSNSRTRMAVKRRAEAGSAGHLRSQGLGENPTGPAIPTGAA